MDKTLLINLDIFNNANSTKWRTIKITGKQKQYSF